MAEKKQGKPIDITKRVAIKGTATSKTLSEKRTYMVHPELASRLVEKKEAEIVKAAKE